LKSCGHKARLVTYEIQNKNTTNTNTHAQTQLYIISENYMTTMIKHEKLI